MKLLLLVVSIIFSFSLQAQSWLDVFNRYRVAGASDLRIPQNITRFDLRPYVTLSRHNQSCSDCRIEVLTDSGHLAVSMQGRDATKDETPMRDANGNTLLSARDMEFLRVHSWDGAGKIFIGGTIDSPEVSPQSLIMAMVTQIAVRGRAMAIGLSGSETGQLILGYRLLPIVENDIKPAIVYNGKMVYPVILRFNLYLHEAQLDQTLAPFDFQNTFDRSYSAKTRIAREASVVTFQTEFLFDQPLTVEQNGYRAVGSGRLLNTGRWVNETMPIKYLWVSSPYGSSAPEHPALSPVALKLIEEKRWNAPELTKRLTTMVSLNFAHDAIPWLDLTDLKDNRARLGLRRLLAKKIEHAFHRESISVKVWDEGMLVPRNPREQLRLRMTFYSNYDQSKVMNVFSSLGLEVDFNELEY